VKKTDRPRSRAIEPIISLIESLDVDDRRRLCALLHQKKLLEPPARREAEQASQAATLAAEQEKALDELNLTAGEICRLLVEMLDLLVEFYTKYKESHRGPDREMDEILAFVEKGRASGVPVKLLRKQVNEKWSAPDCGKRYKSDLTFMSTISTAKKARQERAALLATLKDHKDYFLARSQALEPARKSKGEQTRTGARNAQSR
jgi:hypothetical protein